MVNIDFFTGAFGRELDVSGIHKFQRGLRALELFADMCLLSLFQNEGYFKDGSGVFEQELRVGLKVHEKYTDYFSELLRVLLKGRFLYATELGLVCGFCFDITQELKSFLYESIIEWYPSVSDSASFLFKVLSDFMGLISGRHSILPLMFPGGEFKVIDSIYRSNPDAYFYNQVVGQAIKKFVRQNFGIGSQPLRVLEVGAGIGATTELVLPVLESENVCAEYIFSDISRAFMRNAESKFFERFPFLRFMTLNIEQEPKDQGVLGQFDIIIAANVLHATENVHASLVRVKNLLKPGGLLVLNEGVAKKDYSTFAYGCLDGWWRFKDKENRIEGSPFLSLIAWKRLLLSAGFSNVLSFNESCDLKAELYQDVILAS